MEGGNENNCQKDTTDFLDRDGELAVKNISYKEGGHTYQILSIPWNNGGKKNEKNCRKVFFRLSPEYSPTLMYAV